VHRHRRLRGTACDLDTPRVWLLGVAALLPARHPALRAAVVYVFLEGFAAAAVAAGLQGSGLLSVAARCFVALPPALATYSPLLFQRSGRDGDFHELAGWGSPC